MIFPFFFRFHCICQWIIGFYGDFFYGQKIPSMNAQCRGYVLNIDDFSWLISMYGACNGVSPIFDVEDTQPKHTYAFTDTIYTSLRKLWMVVLMNLDVTFGHVWLDGILVIHCIWNNSLLFQEILCEINWCCCVDQ